MPELVASSNGGDTANHWRIANTALLINVAIIGVPSNLSCFGVGALRSYLPMLVSGEVEKTKLGGIPHGCIACCFIEISSLAPDAPDGRFRRFSAKLIILLLSM